MRKMMWLVGVAMFAVAHLAGAVELKEGQNFMTYKPQRDTEARDKIEVTEFFWYGCGHCFHLEPELQKWLKTLPTALYYTLDAMGLGEKLHSDIFNAVNIERADVLSEKGMVDWLGKKGVDTKTFSATYQSFAIRSKVLRAMQISQAHGLDGVPALIVDGRYRAINGEDTFAVVDSLIDKARKDRAAKK
jgi:thiol:disulfide interchange protein DsbA